MCSGYMYMQIRSRGWSGRMEAQEETLLVLKEHSTLVHKAGWLVCVPLPLPHEARPRDTPWARRYVIGHMPLFEATGTRRIWMRRAPPCSRQVTACLLVVEESLARSRPVLLSSPQQETYAYAVKHCCGSLKLSHQTNTTPTLAHSCAFKRNTLQSTSSSSPLQHTSFNHASIKTLPPWPHGILGRR